MRFLNSPMFASFCGFVREICGIIARMVQSPESGRLTCSTNITIKLSVRMCLSAILIYTNKSAKFIYFSGSGLLRGALNLVIFSKKYHSTQEKHTRAHVLRGLSPIPHPFWSGFEKVVYGGTDGILKSCAYPDGSSLCIKIHIFIYPTPLIYLFPLYTYCLYILIVITI